MRIAQLYASQFLGIANVDLELTAPIHLFAGRNGAGKSSLRDAIALALTADLGRVSLKKEAPQLIHDGADGAHCELTTSDGDKYAVSITAGGKITDSQKGRENDPALAYVLDAPGRTELLTWLHTLADLGEVDTVFLFGTLKSEPTGLPSTIQTHWIENGVVSQLKEAA